MWSVLRNLILTWFTESGETMKAAGLKAIDTVVSSTAILVKSKNPSNSALVDLIASRIRGVIAAQKYVLCQYNVQRTALHEAVKITPGKRAPTINALEEEGWVAVSSMVEKKKIAVVMDELTAVGATDILILDIANTRAGWGYMPVTDLKRKRNLIFSWNFDNWWGGQRMKNTRLDQIGHWGMVWKFGIFTTRTSRRKAHNMVGKFTNLMSRYKYDKISRDLSKVKLRAAYHPMVNGLLFFSLMYHLCEVLVKTPAIIVN